MHFGRSRLFSSADRDTALLLGDYLFAHGLVRIAATGSVDAVSDLAELISLCAQALGRRVAGRCGRLDGDVRAPRARRARRRARRAPARSRRPSARCRCAGRRGRCGRRPVAPRCTSTASGPEPSLCGGRRSRRAPRRCGLPPRPPVPAELAAPLDLGVDLGAEEQRDSREPEPGQHHDHRGERAPDLVVRAELRRVDREQARRGDPHDGQNTAPGETSVHFGWSTFGAQ